jgi:probable 2-oxoglutarate dehydrogenase E1 component DHKTD1
MLRSSCLYKSLQLGMARTCLLTKRCFQYQNEIYVSNFEPSQGDETRRHRLAQANESRSAQPNLHRFIRAYQENGFKMGRVNPLGHHVTKLDELDLKNFGLSGSQQFPVDNLLFSTSKSSMTIDEIESYLREVYANKMTIEFDYIQNEEEKLWIATQFEKLQCEPISATSQLESLKLMLKSQALDHFLALKFPTFKRYSLEGGESAMAFYHSLLSNAAKGLLPSMSILFFLKPFKQLVYCCRRY